MDLVQSEEGRKQNYKLRDVGAKALERSGFAFEEEGNDPDGELCCREEYPVIPPVLDDCRTIEEKFSQV
ncbi:hypothetical protein CEXT_775631 [Caerostris extrusa]|uniref:Uncharacterized protein n=1 Tax=Caerostris extrusa TaxID=172846 RepID=A0AAV4U326_CAEEX|nr:hypothetical protein CEXT_775631 [Caerostris extrusa]